MVADSHIRIRLARDADAPELIELIAAVYAEYPGCILDVAGETPHLLRPASSFANWNGRLWVAEGEDGVAGCGGYRDDDGGFELKHLYVATARRRQGLASRFMTLVETDARRRGRSSIELWTDSRFDLAHRFYEARGYIPSGRRRELFDLSRTLEYHYWRRP